MKWNSITGIFTWEIATVGVRLASLSERLTGAGKWVQIMSEPPGSDMISGKINQRWYNCTGASNSHREVFYSSLLFTRFSRGTMLWVSGAVAGPFTVTWFWEFNCASIRFCHLSKGWNRSQMLFYFWQLQPATPGESKTISRPPERFSAFKVLSASPLALLPVGLTCFISTGRSQTPILARLGRLCFVQRSWSTYKTSWIPKNLTLLQGLCLRSVEKWQSGSWNLCSYLPIFELKSPLTGRGSQPRPLLTHDSGTAHQGSSWPPLLLVELVPSLEESAFLQLLAN